MQAPLQGFPEHIYEVAREHRVGVPSKAYMRAIFKWQIIVGALWLLLHTVALVLSIQNYFFDKRWADQPPCLACPVSLQQQISQDNTEALTRDITNMVGEALLLAVFPVVLLLVLYFRRKWPVYLCSEGLLVTTRKKTEATRWDEIDAVYWKSPGDVFLRKVDGEDGWHLKQLSNNQEIVEVVEREVSPRLLEQALLQYEKSGIVEFGCLSVNKEGIVNNSPALSWNNDERVVHWRELEDIRFLAGALSIKVQGQWKRWDGGPRAQKRLKSVVPNPMVYAALVKRLWEKEHL